MFRFSFRNLSNLLLAEEDGSDEGRELLMGFGTLEVFPPAMVEFHETGMGLVTKNDLGIAAGLCPIAELLCLSLRARVFVVIPFVLDKEFVGSGTGLFSCERVMKMFFLGNRDVVHTLFGGFLECSGDAFDPVADSTMCHNSKRNN